MNHNSYFEYLGWAPALTLTVFQTTIESHLGALIRTIMNNIEQSRLLCLGLFKNVEEYLKQIKIIQDY